jgi:GTPase SAR1 family protein
MVGPDGVGKTTLLATMYHQLSQLIDSSHFNLTASADTAKDLFEAYEKLSSILTQPTFTPTGPLLRGTAGIIERQFSIFFKQKRELELIFCDIAGGLIRAERENHPDFQYLTTQLEQSSIIINVIDGSALVESEELSQLKNAPQQISKLLQPSLTQTQHNHLILFVITKCEAWLKDEVGKSKLELAFEMQYEWLLKQIATLNHCSAVLIPVKTLGCVEFTRLESQGENQEMIFVRKPNLPFAPEKTEQPLRYALAFALSQHDQRRSRWRQVVRWLRHEDIAFQRALLEFAQARDRSFKIYGNSSLLEV